MVTQANPQNLSLEWTSVWGTTCTEFQRNTKDFPRSFRVGDAGELAELEFRVDLSLGYTKCKELQKEHEGLPRSLGLMTHANPQNLSLE